MPALKICISPELTPWRPEITWAWRTILSTIGWSWEEAPVGQPCHILHGAPAGDSGVDAPLVIRADCARWASAPGLAGVERQGDLVLPGFAADGARAAVEGGLAFGNEAVGAERDLIFDFFWLASGGAEAGVPRDQHGTLLLPGLDAPQRHLWYEGAASTIVSWLEALGARRGWPVPQPRWPHGCRAVAAAGHDVDYPEVIRWLEPARIVRRQGVPGLRPAWEVLLGRRGHWHFADWMAFEQELGARSAFYFVPRQGSLWQYARGLPDPFYDVTAPHFRRLFAELLAKGFEVGLHTSYLAFQSAEAIRHEREVLSVASGHEVAGNRHHYWHLRPDDVDETLLFHEQAGLLYDTSLTNDRYLGWRRGICTPWFPFHKALRRPLGTLQISTAWMDDHIFGAAARNPGAAEVLLHGLAQRALRMGGVLLIDVHDYVYDDRLYPGWRAAYRTLWEAVHTMGGFWMATPVEIARHWIERNSALLQASRGLDLETVTRG